MLGADLEGDRSGVVDEHPVAARAQQEGHVLVGLLGVGAAIGVPDVDRLSVLHEGTETFAEPVDGLAHPQAQLFVDVGSLTLDRRVRDRALRGRSEEHTSELQSRGHLVCRLLLEKKNKLKHCILYAEYT